MSTTYDADQDPALEVLTLIGEEFTSGGITCTVLPGDVDIPAQLVVPIEGEDGRSSTVHVCFLPGQVDPAVLQYLVVLDGDVPPAAVPDLARFLHMVNATLPVTGFELGEAVETVVFRYQHAVSLYPLDPGVVAWSLSMIHHAVSRFEPLVQRAFAGDSFAELVAGFGAVQAELFAPDDEDETPT